MTLKGLLIIIHLDLLLPLAVLLNVYLYFYPIFHFCTFTPTPSGAPAPFRLLALADPQLEGDSTLRRYRRPDSDGSSIWDYIHSDNLLLTIRGLAKALDLWGNDLYLAHVYRTTRQTLDPTHTVVLGDLVGSQWISDTEFEKRGDRFWQIFKGGEKVTKEDVDGVEGLERRKVVALPGNHDVGYAGDMTRQRVDRFEDMFGPVNYAVHFPLPDATTAATLRILVLNSLTLDSPIFDQSLQDDSLSLVTRFGSDNSTSRQSTLLLTHLPLHKPAGVCVDGPLVSYFEDVYGGGIQEQNHLSKGTSELLLSKLFGIPSTASGGGRAKERGIILTGHDHEGCDVRHSWIPDETKDGSPNPGWNATTWEDWSARRGAEAVEGVREITVRSMMGEYGGNSGLLSAWFDDESDSWRFGYETCKLGVQHIWWAVHIVDVVCLVSGLVLFVAHTRDAQRNVVLAAKMQEEVERRERKKVQ